MAILVKPSTFSTGAVILASEHNSNFDTLYNDYNGNISNVNLSATASIADTKLAQITTASKVSGTALTGLASVPSGAGVLPSVNGGVPSGAILAWSGAVSAIPSGWVICDGTNSTPDLTDRFILHADADAAGTNNVGDTGGADTTSIPVTGWGVTGSNPGPAVSITSGRMVVGSGSVETTETLESLKAAGSAQSVSIVPKYYALAYIMKT